MNIGVICEYNPFHYGHLYQINKIKEMYPNSNIIIVMSGWLTERGDLSLIDKFKKADIALNYGIDLVVELPFKYIQSADYFAKGSIEILNKLGCEKIIFGSESNNIEELINLANIQLNNKNYDKLVKEYLDEGINYPTAMSKALKTISNKTVNTPNDILGLCYVKEIIKNNFNITPITIKRDSNFNSKVIEGKITSATSIRELIKKNKKFKKYVPSYSYKYLKNCIFLEDYFDYLKYKIISSNNLTIYQGIDADIENRIKKYINKSNTLDELLNLIKTKRYTYNKINRMLIHILTSFTKKEASLLKIDYIRLLGFSTNGQKYLNTIKKDLNLPIITTYKKNFSQLLDLELRATSIYYLPININELDKEYKHQPLKKESK